MLTTGTAAAPDSVVITGGGGRLGSAVARQLASTGHRVTAVDVSFPGWLYDPALGVRCVEANVLSVRAPRELGRAFAAARTVVHLAGLHGLHLRQGARLADLWQSNVDGTRRVAEAAAAAGAERIVLASTTALYGPGTPAGEPAAILDERRRPEPDNPYATSKLAAESVLSMVDAPTTATVVLRLGRFFREDEPSYQLRKLSTGLDLADAVDAVVAACGTARVPGGVYCVASDLPLPRPAREYLGIDCLAVLDEHLPGFVPQARRRGWELPARVGRSVDSGLLRDTTGYRPRRTLAEVAERWATTTTVRATKDAS